MWFWFLLHIPAASDQNQGINTHKIAVHLCLKNDLTIMICDIYKTKLAYVVPTNITFLALIWHGLGLGLWSSLGLFFLLFLLEKK